MSFLSLYFRGVAAKILSSVEINRWQSNQHEFHGVKVLKNIFGLKRQYFNAKFIYFDRNGKALQDTGQLTWYDAREYSLDRTEHRLYYTDSNAVNNAQENDLMIVGLRSDNTVIVIIADKDSEFCEKLKFLFGIKSLSTEYKSVNLENSEVSSNDIDMLMKIGIAIQ
ncbi:hypothetical protein R50345_30535 [Paenibacillus sp. FSL R5-0345]|uniref:hypothetical protein n=1 Tax=Paenibacillus sp. FSL R5-0345 TaxID=1536770 RepID=UPI0004F65BE7|nr:hypothetical protein [Paenibacillus sp. FSL R5-0345]AIQ38570.1 hypothetical protein R50345_30535 [Paenibacillus sp. FSL R5-0345]